MLNRFIHTTFIAITLSMWSACPSWADSGEMEHVIEFHLSGSNNKTPLWLNANKYGLSSLNSKYAYARGIVSYKNSFDHWGIDYKIGADLVLPFNFKSAGYQGAEYRSLIILQQLYAEVKWKHLVLIGGSKQFEAELRDNQLSSGAQTLGINARPIPQGRMTLDDWWNIPLTHQWLAFKGHIAYGIMTDANWEEEFVGNSGKQYNRWTRFHEKAGYLRIGNVEKFPLSLTLGLQMAAQFGGTVYNYHGTDQSGYRGSHAQKLQSGLKSYFNAFFPGGGDTDETQFQNAEGNQVGSWIARLNWEQEQFAIGIYGDHFFEDHSSMFFLDYDGYGTGAEWNTKKEFKFLFYPLRDGQIGIDLKLKKFKYLQGAVLEYMNTTYQSGPIYHDHNQTNPDHIGGGDDYYNHYSLPGWQHWGQSIGNPLFRSPQYNTNGSISFEANRFRAFHAGIRGSIIDGLDYRILYSSQKSFGTHLTPVIVPEKNKSMLFELEYQFQPNSIFNEFKVKTAYGSDSGKLLGDSKGLQITVVYKPSID